MADEVDSVVVERVENTIKSAPVTHPSATGHNGIPKSNGSVEESSVPRNGAIPLATGQPSDALVSELLKSPPEEVDARPLTEEVLVDLLPAADASATDARPVVPTETDARPFAGGTRPGERPASQVPTDKNSSCYNLDGPKLAIVFNHKEYCERFELKPRRGTEVDVAAIKTTFQSVGWAVRVYNDAKLDDIQKVIRDVQNKSKCRE